MRHFIFQNLLSRLTPWMMWGLGVSAFFIEYIIRVAPASMVPSLMETFKASPLDISAFGAYFLYAYVLMQIPVGLLVDRFGARICLSLSTGICAFSTFLFAMTEYLWIAQLARFLLGFGAAFALVGALKLALMWFKPQSFSIIVGLSQALGMVGGAAGVAIMGRLAELENWQISTEILGWFLASLACLIALFVRNEPFKKISTNSTTSTKETKTTIPILESIKIVFRHPQTWLIAIFAGLLYMPTAVVAELWGSFYFTTTQGITTTAANDGMSIIFVGWALGGPLSGVFANRFGRRPVMIFSSFSSMILITAILYLPALPLPFLYGLLFMYGLSNSGMTAAYTAIAELNPKAVAGVALAFGNGMSVIIGAFCQQIIGALIDWLQSNPMFIGSDNQTQSLKIAMLLVVVGVVAAFIVSLFTRETLNSVAEQ